MEEQIFPTKVNLINLKKSLSLANVGYDLMERKRKVLIKEVNRLNDEYKSLLREAENLETNAKHTLNLATVADGMPLTAAQAVPVENGVSVTVRSVMGTEIPSADIDPADNPLCYGLSGSGVKLDEAAEQFNELKKVIVRLAGLETAMFRLGEAVDQTVKRSNALGNIVIPKYTSDIKYISESLDEKDREEFARLKVIKKSSN